MESASKYGVETVMIISASSYHYHTLMASAASDCVAVVAGWLMMGGGRVRDSGAIGAGQNHGPVFLSQRFLA